MSEASPTVESAPSPVPQVSGPHLPPATIPPPRPVGQDAVTKMFEALGNFIQILKLSDQPNYSGAAKTPAALRALLFGAETAAKDKGAKSGLVAEYFEEQNAHETAKTDFKNAKKHPLTEAHDFFDEYAADTNVLRLDLLADLLAMSNRLDSKFKEDYREALRELIEVNAQVDFDQDDSGKFVRRVKRRDGAYTHAKFPSAKSPSAKSEGPAESGEDKPKKNKPGPKPGATKTAATKPSKSDADAPPSWDALLKLIPTTKATAKYVTALKQELGIGATEKDKKSWKALKNYALSHGVKQIGAKRASALYRTR